MLLGALLFASCNDNREQQELLARISHLQAQRSARQSHCSASEAEQKAAQETMRQVNQAHLDFMAAYTEEIVHDYFLRTKEKPSDEDREKSKILAGACRAQLLSLAPLFPPDRPTCLPSEDWERYQESYFAQAECIQLTRQLFDADHPLPEEKRAPLLSRLTQARERAYQF